MQTAMYCLPEKARFYNNNRKGYIMELPKEGQYDATVSESKEESLAKAIEIMMQQMNHRKDARVIVRPKVSVFKGLIPTLLYLAALIAGLCLADNVWVLIGVLLMALGVAIIFAKRFCIWLILLYQRFAPEKIRRECCYQPSCSEYMKLAIEKYGVIKGIYRGCKRLSRCHWPNGGIDEP